MTTTTTTISKNTTSANISDGAPKVTNTDGNVIYYEKTVGERHSFLVTIRGSDGGGTLMNRDLRECELTGASQKQTKEDPMSREWRVWRDKIYWSDQFGVHWPGENIATCLEAAAVYWKAKVPGAGSATFTQLVHAGITCEPVILGIMDKESPLIVPFAKMVNANPSKGKKSGAKVFKIRPLIQPWGGSFRMHVLDPRLTQDVLATIISYAGVYVGLADWRPQMGRFDLVSMEQINL